MAKAKKLPSGSWRVQVYSYTDENGVKHKESFTGYTKAEAEMKAAEFAANKKRRIHNDLTVGEAVDGYIAAKEGVLSPSTIRGYIQTSKHNIDPIRNKKIRTLTSEDLQIFVSNLSQKKSPKTVRNVYSLVSAAIALYYPDAFFRVTLPHKKVSRPSSPSDDDVMELYNSASTLMKMYICFAMRGVRRGEMCALKHEDIQNGIAHIHADIVMDKNKQWIYKEFPKTDGSDRFVKLPEILLDMIGDGEGFIVQCTPDNITKRFTELRKAHGHTMRFHDLRHYFASVAAVLNIPDIYTADMGGWRRDSSVMKAVYQNNITPLSDFYADKMNDHIDQIIRKKQGDQ